MFIFFFKCACFSWQTSVEQPGRKQHVYSLWGSFHVVGMGEEQGGSLIGVTFRGQLMSRSWVSVKYLYLLWNHNGLFSPAVPSRRNSFMLCVFSTILLLESWCLHIIHPWSICQMHLVTCLLMQLYVSKQKDWFIVWCVKNGCDCYCFIRIYLYILITHLSCAPLTLTGSSFSLSSLFFIAFCPVSFKNSIFPSDPVSTFNAQLFHSHCFSLCLPESHVGFSVHSDAPAAAYASFLAFAKISHPPICRPLMPLSPVLSFLGHLLFCAAVIRCAFDLITWCWATAENTLCPASHC